MEKFVKGEKKEWAGLRQSLVKLCDIRKKQINKKEKGEMTMEKTLEQMLEDDERERREFHRIETRLKNDRAFLQKQVDWICILADGNNMDRHVAGEIWTKNRCPDLTTREGMEKMLLLIDDWFSADLL